MLKMWTSQPCWRMRIRRRMRKEERDTWVSFTSSLEATSAGWVRNLGLLLSTSSGRVTTRPTSSARGEGGSCLSRIPIQGLGVSDLMTENPTSQWPLSPQASQSPSSPPKAAVHWRKSRHQAAAMEEQCAPATPDLTLEWAHSR